MSETTNPYVESRHYWDNLYGQMQTRLTNSYRLMGLLVIELIIAVVSLFFLARQSSIQPYVVMLRGHELVTVQALKTRDFQTMQPTLALNFAAQWLRQVRAHATDPVINREHQVASFAMTAGQATHQLQTFYQQQKGVVGSCQITIHTILMKAPGEIELRWVETHFDPHGHQQAQTHYAADMHYQYQPPSSNPLVLKYNPLGFYITHIAWTNDLTEAT